MAPVETPLAPEGFRPGSCRGGEGFFRVAQDDDDRWWLLDPEGRSFFCRAVNGVNVARPLDDTPLPRDSAARLRGWGFSALGTDCDDAALMDGFPVLATIQFSAAGPLIVAPGARLPDVFDADWPRLATARAAEICTPQTANRQLLGWVTDSAAAWAQPAGTGKPSLLQLCLSLEPNFAAYHAAWEFVLALHGGRLELLARAWGIALPNKEMVREMTRSDSGIATRGYLRDEARWTREYARRYFTTTANAIRSADPNHLVLGCRFGGGPGQGAAVAGANVLAECVYPAVDIAMPPWRELPAGAAMPVLAADVDWTEGDFQRTATARDRRLTSVERMLRRARLALERLAAHPAVTGYIWREWVDSPADQPPFGRGLVHLNGRDAREHTELLADFNHRAEAIRRARRPVFQT
ncbi:MAG: hypothetical protein Q7S40_27825 [Opitutaceae bacterium]|nr:hypothetical protein [Opitutaceae bacterium]